MSPGTSSSKATSRSMPSRTTVHVLETRPVSAAAASPLLASWMNFMPPERTSIAAMTIAVDGSRSAGAAAMTST